jgi:transposase
MNAEEQHLILAENTALKTENATLSARLVSLETLNAQLLVRVANLEAQLTQNSRNSSKPPSQDSFNPPPKSTNRSLRRATGKKPGAQGGHAGHTLSWNDQPNQVIEHRPAQCGRCHGDLSEQPVINWQSHQVLDLPQALKLVTIEHRAALVECRHCQTPTRAEFPLEAEHYLQYGPHLRAWAVYLCQGQLLPYARTCEVISEMFGVELSQGTLLQMLAECYDHLQLPEELIQHRLIQAEVVHGDETGLYVEGQRLWLHVLSTAYLTYYAYHKRRGRQATDEIGLLPHFKGRLVHDSWASYWAYLCLHALCNAHILRELTFLAEQLGQIWAKRLIEFLIELKAQVEQAKADGEPALSAEALAGWALRYRNLITEGLAANPPPPGGWPKNARGRPKQTKARNLADRLQQHQAEVLAFAYDFRVPFDNNQAERDLRMMKVRQKISGGFRSRAGATYFCRIRGYISTMRKQGESAFKVLQQAFLGYPMLPKLPPV